MQASKNAFIRLATAAAHQRPAMMSTGRVLSVASFHSTSNLGMPISPKINHQQWNDPLMRQYKFWNKEEATEPGKFSYRLEISPESVRRDCRILSLSDPDDDANRALHQGSLPMGAELLGVGITLEDFDQFRDRKPNALFVSPSCPRACVQLPLILAAFPTIEWVHVRSAGIDFIVSAELNEFRDKIYFSNAKGQFSSSLAEYVMMACSYFAKDLPRLMRNKHGKKWDSYDIEELRGKTLGIVGYGDIGRATAKLASVYGMRIIALRRHPYLSKDDPYCDLVYGRDKESLNALMSQSDYILSCAPSTISTRGMVNAEAFENAKDGAVFINIGRGPVIDEAALLKHLKNGRLKGAALDVFHHEPLPTDSEFWDLENVLLSPHNMDKTSTFMHEATEFFVNENLPRFLCEEDLLNPVDVQAGY